MERYDANRYWGLGLLVIILPTIFSKIRPAAFLFLQWPDKQTDSRTNTVLQFNSAAHLD